MRRFVSIATAGAMMIGTAMAGATSASAAPIVAAPVSKAVSAKAGTELVEEVGRRGHRGHHRRHFRRHRGHGHGHDHDGLGLALGATGLFLGLSALAAQPRYYAPPRYYSVPRRRGGACGYWSQRCAANWGYGNSNYYGCMRYEGC